MAKVSNGLLNSRFLTTQLLIHGCCCVFRVLFCFFSFFCKTTQVDSTAHQYLIYIYICIYFQVDSAYPLISGPLCARTVGFFQSEPCQEVDVESFVPGPRRSTRTESEVEGNRREPEGFVRAYTVFPINRGRGGGETS